MSNSRKRRRLVLMREYDYRLRRCVDEISKVIQKVRVKGITEVLPQLYEAVDALEAIEPYSPRTDLKKVNALLSQNIELMRSVCERLKGDQWTRKAREAESYLFSTFTRLMTNAFLQGRLDLLQSLMDMSDRIESFDIDDPNIDRAAFMAALDEIGKSLEELSAKELANVE